MSDSTTAQIPTPRTDAAARSFEWWQTCRLTDMEEMLVPVDEVRSIERELAQTTLERNVEANAVTQLSRKVLAMQAYINYLGEAEAMTIGLLCTHDWRFPADFIQRGEALRAAIIQAAHPHE